FSCIVHVLPTLAPRWRLRSPARSSALSSSGHRKKQLKLCGYKRDADVSVLYLAGQ
uniref:Uncharacterized protein n=1 Tax=Crocodylus porosus TaxID=8502 RepID=A0A7M4F9V2_CROPO